MIDSLEPNVTPAATSLAKRAGIAATIVAGVMCCALATRPINSPDVGYHLTYGEYFLDTGHIVSTNKWIYTDLDKEALARPANVGPDCWYDAKNNSYHFINANWLSQALMALAVRAGGMTGLSILQVLLILALLAPIIVTCRRNDAPWHIVAAAMILTVLAIDERIPIRPEVFGYLVLAWQWCLLAGPGFGPKRAAAVALLQVLAVNLHSYFLLSTALTGAMFLAALFAWRFPGRGGEIADVERAARRSRAKWLGWGLLGIMLATLVNPWFYRGALMPIETLLYMREQHIGGGGDPTAQMHPWATLFELKPTFSAGLAMLLRYRATTAYLVCLAATIPAAIWAVWRRRWGWLLAIVGMVLVSLSMRRNTAVAAVILTPISAALLVDWYRALRGARRSRRLDAVLATVAACVAIVSAGAWTFGTVTNRSYVAANRYTRFGLGASEMALPLAAAEWINRHNPAGRIWCDYDNSSNLLYFTHPHREVPVLTNTWACPPAIMLDGLLQELSLRPFDPMVQKYDIQTLVFFTTWKAPTPLMLAKLKDPDWAIVDIGVDYVILLRRQGSTEPLIRKNEITPATFDVATYIKRVSAADPVKTYALNKAADLLWQIGWHDYAGVVWGRAYQIEPENATACAGLADAHCMRVLQTLVKAQNALSSGDKDAANAAVQSINHDVKTADELIRKALQSDPDSPRAAAAAGRLEKLKQLLRSRK